jgi:hypothetical protein
VQVRWYEQEASKQEEGLKGKQKRNQDKERSRSEKGSFRDREIIKEIVRDREVVHPDGSAPLMVYRSPLFAPTAPQRGEMSRDGGLSEGG